MLPTVHRRPPKLYRLARTLRRLSTVALILIIVFLVSAVYSAVRVVESSPQAGGYTAGFSNNNTIKVLGNVSFSNPGLYPVTGFQVTLRVMNSSGVFLGESIDGPTTLPAGGNTTFGIAIYVVTNAAGPAGTLLVTDQPLSASVWGNATFAYFFPVSVHFVQNKSWGAPFQGLRFTPGPPFGSGGNTTVPLAMNFSNHAVFPDVGQFTVVIHNSNGAQCGSATYGIDVPPNENFGETQDIPIAAGCSLAGASADATYVTDGVAVALPPQGLG
jgi:hypothetical protein